MNKLHKFLGLLAWLISFSVQAQDSFSFEAYTNSKQVTLNSYFEVQFTLKNASGTDFAPPSFKDFTVLAGPNTSSSMQIVNGTVTREITYSFTLQPKKAGKFTIGSASIRANGKKLTADPLNIEIVEGRKDATFKGEVESDAFVRLETNKTTAFIGEQILLDYKLYTTVSIDGYEIREEPDFKGFYAQELKRFDSAPMREEMNNKAYTTKILRRIALFPQQAGNISIPPVNLQLAVLEENDRTGFSFRRSVRPAFTTTNPVDITVKALPSGAPATFSGAVGSYEFQASINSKQVITDDAISINMMISGNGDIKRVEPPALLLSDSFEIYAPKVLDEQLFEKQGEIQGNKLVEYLVLPKYPGEYSLSPEFSYFNTSENQYITTSTGPFQLKVRQGSNRHKNHGEIAQDSTASAVIHFIKTQTSLKRGNESFVKSFVFLGLTAFPVLAFLGIFFSRKIQERSVDLTLVKSKQANKEAQKRLNTAQQFFRDGNSRAFYDEISKASLGYVCDKLNIPLSQLTKENVREKLQSLALSASLIDAFMSVIQTCEMALFAGMDNAGDMQTTYEKAIQVISGIEAEIGKL